MHPQSNIYMLLATESKKPIIVFMSLISNMIETTSNPEALALSTNVTPKIIQVVAVPSSSFVAFVAFVVLSIVSVVVVVVTRATAHAFPPAEVDVNSAEASDDGDGDKDSDHLSIKSSDSCLSRETIFESDDDISHFLEEEEIVRFGESFKFVNLFSEAHIRTVDNATAPGDLQRVATYKMKDDCFLSVVHGNVAHFQSSRGAIVNSTNESLLGSSGVSKDIQDKGGDKYIKACLSFEYDGEGVRLKVGKFKMMEPAKYGELKVPCVIHAVGPDFSKIKDDAKKELKRAKAQLKDVYKSILETTLL